MNPGVSFSFEILCFDSLVLKASLGEGCVDLRDEIDQYPHFRGGGRKVQGKQGICLNTGHQFCRET